MAKVETEIQNSGMLPDDHPDSLKGRLDALATHDPNDDIQYTRPEPDNRTPEKVAADNDDVAEFVNRLLKNPADLAQERDSRNTQTSYDQRDLSAGQGGPLTREEMDQQLNAPKLEPYDEREDASGMGALSPGERVEFIAKQNARPVAFADRNFESRARAVENLRANTRAGFSALDQDDQYEKAMRQGGVTSAPRLIEEQGQFQPESLSSGEYHRLEGLVPLAQPDSPETENSVLAPENQASEEKKEETTNKTKPNSLTISSLVESRKVKRESGQPELPPPTASDFTRRMRRNPQRYNSKAVAGFLAENKSDVPINMPPEMEGTILQEMDKAFMKLIRGKDSNEVLAAKFRAFGFSAGGDVKYPQQYYLSTRVLPAVSRILAADKEQVSVLEQLADSRETQTEESRSPAQRPQMPLPAGKEPSSTDLEYETVPTDAQRQEVRMSAFKRMAAQRVQSLAITNASGHVGYLNDGNEEAEAAAAAAAARAETKLESQTAGGEPYQDLARTDEAGYTDLDTRSRTPYISTEGEGGDSDLFAEDEAGYLAPSIEGNTGREQQGRLQKDGYTTFRELPESFRELPESETEEEREYEEPVPESEQPYQALGEHETYQPASGASEGSRRRLNRAGYDIPPGPETQEEVDYLEPGEQVDLPLSVTPGKATPSTSGTSTDDVDMTNRPLPSTPKTLTLDDGEKLESSTDDNIYANIAELLTQSQESSGERVLTPEETKESRDKTISDMKNFFDDDNNLKPDVTAQSIADYISERTKAGNLDRLSNEFLSTIGTNTSRIEENLEHLPTVVGAFLAASEHEFSGDDISEGTIEEEYSPIRETERQLAFTSHLKDKDLGAFSEHISSRHSQLETQLAEAFSAQKDDKEQEQEQSPPPPDSSSSKASKESKGKTDHPYDKIAIEGMKAAGGIAVIAALSITGFGLIAVALVAGYLAYKAVQSGKSKEAVRAEAGEEYVDAVISKKREDGDLSPDVSLRKEAYKNKAFEKIAGGKEKAGKLAGSIETKKRQDEKDAKEANRLGASAQSDLQRLREWAGAEEVADRATESLQGAQEQLEGARNSLSEASEVTMTQNAQGLEIEGLEQESSTDGPDISAENSAETAVEESIQPVNSGPAADNSAQDNEAEAEAEPPTATNLEQLTQQALSPEGATAAEPAASDTLDEVIETSASAALVEPETTAEPATPAAPAAPDEAGDLDEGLDDEEYIEAGNLAGEEPVSDDASQEQETEVSLGGQNETEDSRNEVGQQLEQTTQAQLEGEQDREAAPTTGNALQKVAGGVAEAIALGNGSQEPEQPSSWVKRLGLEGKGVSDELESTPGKAVQAVEEQRQESSVGGGGRGGGSSQA